MKETLNWLQNWFYSQCNGDWEHNTNVIIKNLDNPGWKISINLIDTDWENKILERVIIERSENDWISYKIENNIFQIACGPLNLEEAIAIFREWVEKFSEEK